MSGKGTYIAEPPLLSDGESAPPLLDRLWRLVISPGQPAIASEIQTTASTVGDAAAALSGSFSHGVTLLNVSTEGQTIYLGPAGVTAATGFPLAPGAAIDRSRWQDLALIFAVASAAGAKLRIVGL